MILFSIIYILTFIISLYGELYLSFGAFLNKPIEHKPLEEKNIIAQINSEILAENEQKLKITQSIDEIIY